MLMELNTSEVTDADIQREEKHARTILRNLTEDVPADQLDAAIALISEFTGALPERRAAFVRSVDHQEAQRVVAKQFPELDYEVAGSRGPDGYGTIVHTWTCSVTGAFVRYNQGPAGCTIVESGGTLRRHLWDDLVALFARFEMTPAPKPDNHTLARLDINETPAMH